MVNEGSSKLRGLTPQSLTFMVRTIGVILPSNVGDTVLALPVVAELASRFPKARLILAGGPRALTVFEGDPRVARSLVYGADEHTWRDTLAAVRQLRRERCDLLLDLRHTLLPWVARARIRTSPFHQPPAHLLHRHDRYRWYLETLLRRLKLQDHPALTPDALWAWTEPERSAVAEWWQAWAFDPRRAVIAISPGARSDDKRWPAARFARLCERVTQELYAEVLVTGEADERPVVEEVIRGTQPGVRSAAGQTTVRTLSALVRRSTVIVTNDSAALHVASCVHVPTIALFGPTDPAKYGPRAPRSTIIHRPSLADISVDDVFTAVYQTLNHPVHA